MADLGRIMMITGVAIFLVGLLITFSGRLAGFGNLPGDIAVRGENFSVFIPIGTMIVLSIVLTIIANLVARFWR
jgi:hypothetical protein